MSHKVVTIAQQKGGAGKTTLAAHLAIAWSQQRKRVAVIDIDPQGTLSQWYREREAVFGEDYTGISFSQLSGWRVGSEISRLKREHDIIIIDSPPHTETEAKTAIRHADLIVIPVQPSPADVWATEATIELAKQERLPFMTVLNRVTPNSRLAQSFRKKLAGLAKPRLGNRVAFAAALLEGKSVTETMPRSQAADEVKTLAKDIWRRLHREEQAESQSRRKRTLVAAG